MTTARAMAEAAVDQLLMQPPFLELSPRASATAQVPLPGAPPLPLEDWLHECSDLPITQLTRHHLLQRYGRRGPALVVRAAAEPELGRPLHELRREVAVEVEHAVDGELARTVSDFMWRRTFLAFTPDRGESALPVVADRMARKLGWDRAERDRQLERYHAEVEAAIAPLRAARASTDPALGAVGR